MLPLQGVKVLEQTQYAAGPYGCMILADLGADVIKVEPPEVGEPFRYFGGGYEAAYFVANNRNKRSIAINLKDEDGKKVFSKLMKNSDVFLENLGPGIVDKLGFSYQAALKINPKIIYCAIKGYGAGPYENRPAFDPVIEAESGIMSITGETGRPPVRLGGPVIDYIAGMYGVISIMGALETRKKTGKGEYIEVNMFESAVSMVSQLLNEYAVYGTLPGKLGSGWGCYKAFKASDGYVFVGVISDKQWQKFCEAFSVSQKIQEQFATTTLRMGDENEAKLEKIVQGIVSKMTVGEVAKKLINSDVPGAPVNTMKEVLEDPHLKFRKHFVYMPTSTDVTKTKDQRNAACSMLPIRTDSYEPSITTKWIPAQVLGAQSVEILRELKYSEEQIAALQKRKAVWPYL